MHEFSLTLGDIGRIGSNLRRPECVLTTACGDLYASDSRGGIAHILPDGSVKTYFGKTSGGEPLGANGFAMLADGSFLVAPLAGGGIYRLCRDGRSEEFLAEVDGRTLCCPNFVLLDDIGRVWICVLARHDRKTLQRFSRDRRDGFIVLLDDRGGRIVADGIGFPNEIRFDPTGQYLYTIETVAARLLRYRVSPDGTLGPVERVCEFDDSNMLDGFVLDSEGGAWITALVSNRLWYVSPEGEKRLVIEDSCAEQLVRLTEHLRTGGVPKEILYEDHGSTLRNISSIAFGGPDLMTAFMGSLMGESILCFRSPVAGMEPAHWTFGPF